MLLLGSPRDWIGCRASSPAPVRSTLSAKPEPSLEQRSFESGAVRVTASRLSMKDTSGMGSGMDRSAKSHARSQECGGPDPSSSG